LPVIFVIAMKNRFIRLFIIPALLLASCERAVDFDINEVEPKLVVEATIENGQPPVVYLSKSLGYFSVVDQNTLSNSFVRNAEVYVSNGTLTHKLKEYTVPVGGGYNFYYYSIDPSSPLTIFTGELNKQYSLRIVSEGKEYTATTSIPNTTRRIDSIFWKQAPVGNLPEKVAFMVKATDVPGYGDYIRYFTSSNSSQFYPGLTSVYDDQVIDGTTYTVQVERGVPRNGSGTIPEGYTFFNKGDTVTLKLCNIDKATFDFWRTMEFTYASVGNPFSSPTKVISNISNGGLGYFGGYAVQYRTLIIPR
jgi:Domain of unknown function (DUF4249)